MSKLRACSIYRLLANYVLCPVWLLGFRAFGWLTGLRRLRIGKLSILGDPGFLGLCSSAVNSLERLDPAVHRLLTGRSVWLFQAKQDVPYVGNLGPPWLFSVEPGYVEWKSEGVLARLIYIAFCVSEFPAACTSVGESEARHSVLKTRSRSWLESRGFPRELIECYADR